MQYPKFEYDDIAGFISDYFKLGILDILAIWKSL